ncbi:hypothetical protein [Membranihabitans maritimus]|uniref:hypothetical protein n=1 Tax=Membranihabitans maritimus TaxID=2904244 RepID=UPI001F1E3F64|nr:hypothetical protein [Membranihabitans maritimus]
MKNKNNVSFYLFYGIVFLLAGIGAIGLLFYISLGEKKITFEILRKGLLFGVLFGIGEVFWLRGQLDKLVKTKKNKIQNIEKFFIDSGAGLWVTIAMFAPWVLSHIGIYLSITFLRNVANSQIYIWGFLVSTLFGILTYFLIGLEANQQQFKNYFKRNRISF